MPQLQVTAHGVPRSRRAFFRRLGGLVLGVTGCGTPRPGGRAAFLLSSPVVADHGILPAEFTGDGAGVSPPLTWTGAPADARSYVLLMDYRTSEGEIRCHWALWNIPASVTTLPAGAGGIGRSGLNAQGRPGYQAPHSQRDVVKQYRIQLFALSGLLPEAEPVGGMDRAALVAAMKGLVLGTAVLAVAYQRPASGAVTR